MRILTLSMILIGLFQSTAYAELTLLKEQLFTESEESIHIDYLATLFIRYRFGIDGMYYSLRTYVKII
jgi:hypothetical protein